MLNYSSKISSIIEELPVGSPITVDMFPSKWPRNAVTRALSRLSEKGQIVRIKRGVYSKIKKTRFGEVAATPLEVLAKEVEDDENKCFGGMFLFNNLGLTTQVPTTIEILNNKSSYSVKVGETSVKYVRIRPRIDQKTKPFIAILEVLKSSKSIPDSSVSDTLKWILKTTKGLDEGGLKKLVRISLEFPPRVQALLGCLLEAQKKETLSEKLLQSLNDNSTYRVGQIADSLENHKKWRLKV